MADLHHLVSVPGTSDIIVRLAADVSSMQSRIRDLQNGVGIEILNRSRRGPSMHGEHEPMIGDKTRYNLLAIKGE